MTATFHRRVAAPWLSAMACLVMPLLGTEAQAQTPETLRFCAAEHNPPMSSAATGSGVEVEIGRALAARLGRPFEIVWRDPHQESLEEAVLEDWCDVALGTLADPGFMADGFTPEGVTRTRAYYQSGYLLIAGVGTPPVRRLEQVRDERIAVEIESVPIYTLKQRGHRVHALHDSEAVVRAVAEDRVRYGYLWAPVAARLLASHPHVQIVEEFRSEDRWSFALAVRAEKVALRRALDEAIAALLRDSEIERVFHAYGVPYLRPATELSTTTNGS